MTENQIEGMEEILSLTSSSRDQIMSEFYFNAGDPENIDDRIHALASVPALEISSLPVLTSDSEKIDYLQQLESQYCDVVLY